MKVLGNITNLNCSISMSLRLTFSGGLGSATLVLEVCLSLLLGSQLPRPLRIVSASAQISFL